MISTMFSALFHTFQGFFQLHVKIVLCLGSGKGTSKVQRAGQECWRLFGCRRNREVRYTAVLRRKDKKEICKESCMYELKNSRVYWVENQRKDLRLSRQKDYKKIFKIRNKDILEHPARREKNCHSLLMRSNSYSTPRKKISMWEKKIKYDGETIHVVKVKES
jgi:hypothetical protein